MSAARSCLLCGKPLSRWSGSEEFCSREHRNQYRMRRGMDRLAEANKVSTVMRRRENPKPVAAPRPYGGSEHRSACAPRFRLSAPANSAGLIRPARHTALPRIERFLDQEQAPPAVKPREYQILRRPAERLAQLKAVARHLHVSTFTPAAPVTSPPSRGRALRVSPGAGFRLPAPPQHQFEMRRVKAGLSWNDSPRKASRQSGIPELRYAICPMRLHEAAMFQGPNHDLALTAVFFEWPGLRRLPVNSVRNPDVDRHGSLVRIGAPVISIPEFQPHKRNAGFSSGPVRIPMRPVSAGSVRRLSIVLFGPRESRGSLFIQESSV